MHPNDLHTLASNWSDLQSTISHRGYNNEKFCLIKHKARCFVFCTGQEPAKYFLRVHIRTFQIADRNHSETQHTAHVHV